mgnify:CR=1 FL=1
MNLHKTKVDANSYECTLTVDCSIFGFQDNKLKLLLIKRSVDPYKDHWMLPGGVMGEGKTLEDAVSEVLFSLTGIKDITYEHVDVYSQVDRHPIKRVVSITYYALIKPENHPVIAKNYVSEVAWFPVDDLPPLGFDHAQFFKDSFNRLQLNLEQKLVFGELLPEKFTLKELQDLYESILGQTLDRRNFRKRILQMGLLEPTNEIKVGVQGGPALYKMKN